MPGSSEVMVKDESGKFVGSHGLTSKQADFVRFYVLNGMTQTDAARAAGYGQPASRAVELVRNDNVMAVIRAEQARFLGGDLTNKALKVLDHVLSDTDASARVRVDAAKVVLDRAGFAPRTSQNLDSESKKDITDMSQAELEAFIRRGQEALDNASYPIVDITPTAASGAPNEPVD